ncbi:MAG: hypothetical protein AB7D51_01815 [Desulfovibrionaceae bacterium]|jgi:hypothetical protein
MKTPTHKNIERLIHDEIREAEAQGGIGGWELRLTAKISATEDYMHDPAGYVRTLLDEIEITDDNAFFVLMGLLWGLGVAADPDDAATQEGAGDQRHGPGGTSRTLTA